MFPNWPDVHTGSCLSVKLPRQSTSGLAGRTSQTGPVTIAQDIAQHTIASSLAAQAVPNVLPRAGNRKASETAILVWPASIGVEILLRIRILAPRLEAAPYQGGIGSTYSIQVDEITCIFLQAGKCKAL
ncbi:MAG: hypothetical protein OXC57_02110 [Rhodobacteraceae bacterium]|nr:hypothetical protein [Paracoccaceae bacterium]